MHTNVVRILGYSFVCTHLGSSSSLVASAVRSVFTTEQSM